MSTVVAQSMWSIAGPQFLAGYGTVCAAGALAIGQRWLHVLGPRPQHADGTMPDLGPYELAMLGDGPQLAITSAAAQLHRDGLIRSSVGTGGLEAAGEVGASADPVERAVFDVVRDEPGITTQAMRGRAERSDAVQAMVAELTSDGLLIAPDRTAALARRILLVGGLLALAGTAPIVFGAFDGAAVGWLVLAVAIVVMGTIWSGGRVPVATRRGRAMLQRRRAANAGLARNAAGADCALAVALFGGAVLWLAAPEIASALGVERESSSAGGGGGGGGCGSGCGGCGGCGG